MFKDSAALPKKQKKKEKKYLSTLTSLKFVCLMLSKAQVLFSFTAYLPRSLIH